MSFVARHGPFWVALVLLLGVAGAPPSAPLEGVPQTPRSTRRLQHLGPQRGPHLHHNISQALEIDLHHILLGRLHLLTPEPSAPPTQQHLNAPSPSPLPTNASSPANQRPKPPPLHQHRGVEQRRTVQLLQQLLLSAPRLLPPPGPPQPHLAPTLPRITQLLATLAQPPVANTTIPETSKRVQPSANRQASQQGPGDHGTTFHSVPAQEDSAHQDPVLTALHELHQLLLLHLQPISGQHMRIHNQTQGEDGLVSRQPVPLSWPGLRRLVVAALALQQIRSSFSTNERESARAHSPVHNGANGIGVTSTTPGQAEPAASPDPMTASTPGAGGREGAPMVAAVGTDSSHATDAAAALGARRQEAVAKLLLALWRQHVRAAAHRRVVELAHVSKSGGTTLCQVGAGIGTLKLQDDIAV